MGFQPVFRGKILPLLIRQKMPIRQKLPASSDQFLTNFHLNPLNITKITYGTAIAYISEANGEQFYGYAE